VACQSRSNSQRIPIRRGGAAGRAFTMRALAIDPLHVRALVESGFVEAYRHGGTDASRQHALEDLERATSSDPLNAWAFALRAWSHSSVADHEEAVRLARHAIDLDPTDCRLGVCARSVTADTAAATGQ